LESANAAVEGLGPPRQAGHLLALLYGTFAGERAAGVLRLEDAGHAVVDVGRPPGQWEHGDQLVERLDVAADGAGAFAVSPHRLLELLLGDRPGDRGRGGGDLLVVLADQAVRLVDSVRLLHLPGGDADVAAVLALEADEVGVAARFGVEGVAD